MNPKPYKFGSDILVTLVIAIFGAVLSYGAALSMDDPMLMIGVIYAVCFIALTWKFPHMGLAIAFAVSPFQNDISEGIGPFRMSMGEISVSLCFFVFLIKWMMKSAEMKVGPYLTSIVIYFAICVASSLANWSDAAMTSLLQMALYFLVVPLVYGNLVKRVELLSICLYFYVAVCLFLSIWGLAHGSFFIFGLHKNGVGSSLAMALTICTELFLVQKKTLYKGYLGASAVIIVAGLIFSLSRGAWIGALAGFLVVVGTRGKVKFMAQALFVLVPVIAVFWNLLPEDKKEYATSFDAKQENIKARLDTIAYAQQKFSESPAFGVGVGLRKEVDATNIFWIVLAETGFQGVIAFCSIHFLCLAMIYKTQRYVSRTDPRFSLLVLGGALLFAKFVHGVVDHYWSRGPLMIAWGCCGMATSIYYHEQKRLTRLNISILKAKRLKSRRITSEPARTSA